MNTAFAIIACMGSPLHVALNAHLLSGEASYRSAGIHGYLFNTLAHLPAADPDIHYTVLVGPHATLPEPQRWRVLRSHILTQQPFMRILWEQIAAPLILGDLRPDLFHGMAFSLPAAWHGQSIVTIYDLSFIRYPNRLNQLRRWYLERMTRFSAQRARRVIAISESGRREISELIKVPAEHIDVALPGVGPHFRPLQSRHVGEFRIRQGLPGRYILYVGTIEPRKNLETLLRAYAKLPHKSQVGLVLVGAKGWQTDATFALIQQLGLNQHVILPGYVPTEALPMWYNAADVFVYPSVYEGFGLPLLEAMACGIPVIASDATSLPEAVGADGVLLPPLDVTAWADALAALLDRPDRRSELSQRGLMRAQHFTWENTARQTVKSYHRALKVQ